MNNQNFEPNECCYLSLSGIDQQDEPGKVWKCDNCGRYFVIITDGHLTKRIPIKLPHGFDKTLKKKEQLISVNCCEHGNDIVNCSICLLTQQHQRIVYLENVLLSIAKDCHLGSHKFGMSSFGVVDIMNRALEAIKMNVDELL